MPKFLKIFANKWRVVVLNSKVAAHKLLIRDRKRSHKGMGVCRADEYPIYRLGNRDMVLRVPVYTAPIVVYILKVSSLKTLLLKNADIHNV